MAKPKKLIVGNWKMKPATYKEAEKIFKGVVRGLDRVRGVDVVVCPPIPFLTELKRSTTSKKLKYGGQTCDSENAASRTGEYSPTMLKSVGASFVIVGHSERRALGETNAVVHKKLKAALDAGLQAILCIGESERDTKGEYVTFLQEQLKTAFKGLTAEQLKQIVVAYEPIWAIGKTAAESNVRAEHVHEMVIFVRKFLTTRYNRTIAESVKVLYGGSVEPTNAEELLSTGQADGALIGHASLVPGEFLEIIEIMQKK